MLDFSKSFKVKHLLAFLKLQDPDKPIVISEFRGTFHNLLTCYYDFAIVVVSGERIERKEDE